MGKPSPKLIGLWPGFHLRCRGWDAVPHGRRPLQGGGAVHRGSSAANHLLRSEPIQGGPKVAESLVHLMFCTFVYGPMAMCFWCFQTDFLKILQANLDKFGTFLHGDSWPFWFFFWWGWGVMVILHNHQKFNVYQWRPRSRPVFFLWGWSGHWEILFFGGVYCGFGLVWGCTGMAWVCIRMFVCCIAIDHYESPYQCCFADVPVFVPAAVQQGSPQLASVDVQNISKLL